MHREDHKGFLCVLCASAVNFFDLKYITEIMTPITKVEPMFGGQGIHS
jgi:hypothetical protein